MSEILTPKQRAFVHAYQGEAKGNGVQAARIAGYKGKDETLRAIASENLTKPNIRSILAQNTAQASAIAQKQAINVYEEFRKNFEFVGKLRGACENWLNVGGEFAIEPRTNEIDVVYWDQATKQHVTERLDRVLAKAELLGELPKLTPFIKTVDLREYALKVIDRIDTTLDKFAKMGGDYTKERENPATELAMTEALTQMYIDKFHHSPELAKAKADEFMAQDGGDAVN